MTNEERDSLIRDIHEKVIELRTKNSNDFRVIYGEKGLVNKVVELDSRVTVIETTENVKRYVIGAIGAFIAFAITLIINIIKS